MIGRNRSGANRHLNRKNVTLIGEAGFLRRVVGRPSRTGKDKGWPRSC